MKTTRILLRFDDICPTMNWEKWGEAKQQMDAIGVTALLGVVPDCKDPELRIDEYQIDFWNYIKDLQLQGYSIAMHGLHHVFELKADGIVTRNKISEFAGLPFDVQYEKIKKGKDILLSHGIETDIFFAPAHSFDDNTLKALAANGFKYVSDGMSCKPYKRNGIILIPERSGGVPTIGCETYYTVVLHAHEWVREDKKQDWTKFLEIIKNHRDEIVSFGEYSQRQLGWPLVQKVSQILYKARKKAERLIIK